jgi:hypothetical protein
MSEHENPEEMLMIEASDNLYADMGYPDAEMQLKALLTVDLTLGIRRSGLRAACGSCLAFTGLSCP